MHYEYDILKSAYRYQKKRLKNRYLELVRETAYCADPEAAVQHLLEQENLSAEELRALKGGIDDEVANLSIKINKYLRYEGARFDVAVNTYEEMLTNNYLEDGKATLAKIIVSFVIFFLWVALPAAMPYLGIKWRGGTAHIVLFFVVLAFLCIWMLANIVGYASIGKSLKSVYQEANRSIGIRKEADDKERDKLEEDQEALVDLSLEISKAISSRESVRETEGQST